MRAIQKHSADSARDARQHSLEFTRAAQKQSMDSAKTARQANIDSIKESRKEITQNLAAARKYRESKRYKDSVQHSRNQHIATIHASQKLRTDSLKNIRKHTTDSLVASRKQLTDALKARQKKRTDSILVIRKYKESKRFRDSVFIVKKARTDSIQKSRKTISSNLMASRKKTMDSLKAIRQHITDSSTAVRKHRTDSIAVVRKAKADKLAKDKAEREKIAKAKQKQQLLNMNLKLDLKIKKSQEKWSNENMLKKHWGIKRRIVQNTFTHYNYYFNANRKMEEALANMQRVAKDNFDQRIPLFVFNPNKDSTVFAADMDSVIRKASLGIQIHDPRAKWGEDLYLLLGEAYYYKGDYKNARAAFQYIVAMRARRKAEEDKKRASEGKVVKKRGEQPSVVAPEGSKLAELLKHKSANNEALLWLARTYVQSGNIDNAASVLDLLSSDSKFPNELKGRLALEKAYLALNENNLNEAVDQLAIVATDKNQPEWQRRRAAYIDGQLLQERGSYTAAASKFEYVTDLNPKIDLDFYARKNRAYNLMLAGGNQDDAIASLKSMLKDGKYTTYYEQIYYVLGRLAINSNKPEDAITYLQKSVASTKATKKQKASSFALLGNIYYTNGDYEQSKKSYDSAAIMSIGIQADSTVLLAIKRGKVLDKVSIPARTIKTEDSLLALSAMTEKEQRAVVKRYIKMLAQRRADSIFRAENAGINSVIAQEAPTDNSAPSWYFANPVQLQQGYTDFKRKWGTRTLTDNWQRSSSQGINTGAPTAVDSSAVLAKDNTVELDENGLPTEESLLAFIPSSDEERAAAVKMIQRAYVDLGTAYTKELEDYPRAKRALDSLDKRYPVHPYQAEAIYVRYLIALRQNNLPLAQQYSNQIQQQFASSEYATMVRPTEDGANLQNANIVPVAAYYDETYNQLVDRKYNDVITRVKYATRQYQDDRYGNKFKIVEASAYAGLGDFHKADTLLNAFISKHPSDSLQAWAEQVLQFVGGRLKVVEAARQDSLKAAALKAPPKSAADSTKAALNPFNNPGGPNDTTAFANAPKTYNYNPKETHYFIFCFVRMENRVMGVKAAMGDFDKMMFGDQNLEINLQPMPPSPGGVLAAGTFKNAALAKAYLNKFRETSSLVREFKQDDYQLFVISSSNLLKLLADHDVAPYLRFYKNHY